ncbi:MAG: hypothetical protein AB9869_24750 [Verrucomicrobiia bacterium]
MLLHGIREINHWWKPGRWEALPPKLAAWLAERLEVFRPLILAVGQAVRQLSEQSEAAAPKALPKVDHAISLPTRCRQNLRRNGGGVCGYTGKANMHQRPVIIGSSCNVTAFARTRLYVIG